MALDPHADDLPQLARTVGWLRGSHSLTIPEAAALAGIACQKWQRIEAADHDPTLTELLALSRALRVPVSSLFH